MIFEQILAYAIIAAIVLGAIALICIPIIMFAWYLQFKKIKKGIPQEFLGGTYAYSDRQEQSEGAPRTTGRVGERPRSNEEGERVEEREHVQVRDVKSDRPSFKLYK